MIPVVLGVAILIFTILHFTPGDPTDLILGKDSTEEAREMLRTSMGLDKPFVMQMLNYLKDTFLRFDLGSSYYTGKAVIDEILFRFPYTFLLAFSSMVISVLVGIPLGVIAAVKQNKLGDRISMIIALLGVSMPQFWVGLLLVLLFALHLRILPPSGIGGPQYFILPILANAFGGVAAMARQGRSSMLEVIRSDYVSTARAKGVSKWKTVIRHALPNALIPVITVAGTSFGRSLGGTIIIESVFSIPGIGAYMLSGINNRDYPIVQGCVVFLAVTFSVIMLLVDLMYAFVDPRIKASYVGGRKRRRKRNEE